MWRYIVGFVSGVYITRRDPTFIEESIQHAKKIVNDILK